MHTFNQAWSAVTFQNLFKCKLEATKTQGHSFTDSSSEVRLCPRYVPIREGSTTTMGGKHYPIMLRMSTENYNFFYDMLHIMG